MLNSKSVVNFLLVALGEGSRLLGICSKIAEDMYYGLMGICPL